MTTYLLEIGLEEVPSRFMPAILDELTTRWNDTLTQRRIKFDTVTTTGTYRRLVTTITNIAPETLPDRTRIRGPITSIALTTDGTLSAAGQGFLKKNNASDYVVETEGDKEYIVTYKDIPSAPVHDILGTLAAEVSLGIRLPIAMKWGNGIGPYIRPIHWIVSLLNDQPIPVQLFDIHSGTESMGHRFLGDAAPIRIESATTYFDQLAKANVQVNHHDRHHYILTTLTQIMGPSGEWAPDLVEEVTFLTESPHALIGKIDDIYMALPQPAIIECIQKNQKYFPVIQNGQLTPDYVIIADSVTPANQDIIRRGNHSVLRARLEDVKFFWEEDLKAPLESNIDKLKSIVYQKGLGSVWDKTQRIQTIAHRLAQLIPNANAADVQRAAVLCKSDLVSQMVLEMPKLQGIMGGIYAQKGGETPVVALALSELYQAEIDTTHPESTILAISDRLDTVVSCFANGLIPTGSQDPWGVRRAALAIIRAIRNLRMDITLSQLVSIGFDALGTTANPIPCVEFMTDRLVYVLESDEANPEFVRTALGMTRPTIDHLLNALVQLEEIKSSTEFKSLVETAVRVQRLAAKHDGGSFNPALLTNDERQIIEPLLSTIETPIVAIEQLIPFATILPLYFEKILVMDPDESIRNNRLALLKKINLQFLTIGNFEAITSI